ncbi:YwgA family protein [Virgibacillus sp. NKC19-16]|uniref:YwgA family protein n=1 Tax=Virgibacillus salidurans TaxID=2831673 RepID=UPI001F43C2A4|nr:YwgA family protein [Virgibacillus sp. NKC19-16]UJL46018.1 YwgA family protein [Virgibacillus sp. NKC19-16]
MLTNHARLMQFFSVAKEITGRKKMQKMIYILQKSNVPFEEKFHFHFYGPYSEELTLRVEELYNLGFLNETKEDKGNYSRYHYTITSEGETFLEQFSVEMPAISGRVEMLQHFSSRFLELVATMLYFDDLSFDQMVEKIHRVKGKQNYTDEEMQTALSVIDGMKH